MSNLGSYQLMVILAKKVGGPKALAGVTASAGVVIWELGKRGVRRFKRALENEPEITVVEAPGGELVVLEEDQKPNSVVQSEDETDSIDNSDSGEEDEKLP